MDEYINILKESHITISIADEKFNKLLSDLKAEIDENKKNIVEANKIDLKYSDKKIDVDELKRIIDIYKVKPASSVKDDKYVVKYAGDPYLTLHLILQTIVQKCNSLLIADEYMLGVNKVLFAVISKVLKKYKLDKAVSLYVMTSGKEIDILKNTNLPIIVIGDSFTYQILEQKSNVKFYAYNNILLFYEGEEFEELAEYIINYANENEYEIELIDEAEIDDVIKEINLEENCDVAIFLVNGEKAEEIRSKVKNKIVYINENPFLKVTGRIYNYFSK